MSGDDRLEAIQRLFRSANERLSALAADFGVDGALVPYLCECANPDCLAQVPMTVVDHTLLRDRGDIYLILADHPIAEGMVAERHDGFDIVRIAS